VESPADAAANRREREVPVPVKPPTCPACDHAVGTGHEADCEFIRDLERAFMDAVGLNPRSSLTVSDWQEMTRR